MVPLSVTPTGVTLAWAAASPTKAVFGNAPEGVADTPIALTLTNTGNAAATNVTFGTPTDAQFSISPSMAASIAGGGGMLGLWAGFTPSSLNMSSATSTIGFSGAVCGTSVGSVAFSGQGALGAVTGFPASIDFLGSPCGGAAPADQTFQLSNSGSVPVHITSAAFTGYMGYSTDANGKIVPAAAGGNPGTLTVTVHGSAIPAISAVPGNYTGTVSFTTDIAGDSAHQVSLTQSAQGAILAFDTSGTMNFGTFGNVPAGTTVSQSFLLVNSGNAAATNVTLSAGTPFGVTTSMFATFPASPLGQSDSVTFHPPAFGPYTSNLSVTASSLCQPLPAPIAVGGIGQAGGVAISAQSVNFQTNCGAQSSAQTFTVTNNGNQPMSFTGALMTGTAYSVAVSAINGTPTGNSLGTTIASTGLNPMDVATITVAPAAVPGFPPLANNSPAIIGDTLTLTTSGIPGDSPHQIALTDTPLGDVLLFYPAAGGSSINFGNVPINKSSSSQNVGINNFANPGSMAANVTVTSGSPSVFVVSPITSGVAFTMSPGGGFFFGSTFQAPSTANTYSSTFTVSVPGGEILCAPLPNMIAVSGQATVAGPQAAPSPVIFGDPISGLVNCGTTAGAQQVTVTNSGTQDFNITGLAVDNTTYFQTPTMNSVSGLVQANGGNSVTITITPNGIPQNAIGASVPNYMAYSGTLTITTNANSPTPNLTVPLTMGAQGVIINNALATNTWTFPTTRVGRHSQLAFFMSNGGNETVQVALSGLAGNVFSLGTPTAQSSAPGSLKVVGIFAPTDPTTGYADQATLQVTPTTGNVFCAPLPSSWSNPTITLSGQSQ